jgi:hypothetical protein
MICKAKQYSDQMICDSCGLQWDVNDPDKPVCNPMDVHTARERLRGARIPKVLRVDGVLLKVKAVGWPVNNRQHCRVGNITISLPVGKFDKCNIGNTIVEWIE